MNALNYIDARIQTQRTSISWLERSFTLASNGHSQGTVSDAMLLDAEMRLEMAKCFMVELMVMRGLEEAIPGTVRITVGE